MPLRLPNLDDLTWEDLNAEARSLIPARSQQWTDHNPSDPGITLIELFAYVSESLMYQLNRISRNNMIAFLRLINGPHWELRQSLEDEKRAAVVKMREPHRAVTAADYETLAMGVNATIKQRDQPRVARAKCVFARNLETANPAARNNEVHGHVSVVIVPTESTHSSRELLRRVRETLEPARLITTRVHTVLPRYLTVGVRLALTAKKRVDPVELLDEATVLLETFFDPLKGGLDGKGWPFGRSIYISELYQLLKRLPGLDYVSRVKNSDTGEEMAELIVPQGEEGRMRWNKQKELEAVHLLPDELVKAEIGEGNIEIVPA